MKTIKELTETIKVSKVSIYKAIKRDEIQGHITKRDNTTYIDETGEQLLIEMFKLNSKETEINSQVKSEKALPIERQDDEIIFLREQIKEMQSELKTEREHSRNIAEKLAELTHNSQVLLKQEQERNTHMLEEPTRQKASVWERLFNKANKKVNMT
jgi:DNA-binding transcriptional MocR family regulator